MVTALNQRKKNGKPRKTIRLTTFQSLKEEMTFNQFLRFRHQKILLSILRETSKASSMDLVGTEPWLLTYEYFYAYKHQTHTCMRTCT